MASPYSEPTATSPYNFGLGSDFEIALIQPFVYFFSAVFLDIIFPPEVAQKPASLTEKASPNTCSLTQHDEHLASIDQRRNTIGQQAAIFSIFILIIIIASRHLDLKWHDPYAFYSWYDPHSFVKNKLFDSVQMPPPDDYRVTQRREAMRLLFLVVTSALLCPTADLLFGRGRIWVIDRLLDEVLYVGQWPRLFVLILPIPIIFVFSRYGVLWGVRLMMVLSPITAPCVATAAVSVALTFGTCGRRYGVVDIWDRRIERWVEVWERGKSKVQTDERVMMWKKIYLGKTMREVRDEVQMGERNQELLIWRKGMKEGRGYGPDYWVPREKRAFD